MNRRRLLLQGLVALGAPLALGACNQSSTPASAANAVAGPVLPAELPSLSRRVLDEYSSGFTVGKHSATTVVHVFFDTQCPYCAMLWKNQEPLLEQARFTWIPLGFLSRASVAQGATLLGAADPVAAMNEHERLLAGKKGGGISANDDAVARLSGLVRTNTEFAQRLSLESVPTFFVSKPGRVPTRHQGAPSTEQLAAILKG